MTYTVLLISVNGSLDGSREAVSARDEVEAIHKANESWGAVVAENELYSVWPDDDFSNHTRFYSVDHTRVPYRTHNLA